MSVTPLVLNGAHGEGGGALLRTALAMSALTQQPVRVHGVRGGLRRPGLSSEDLVLIRALETTTQGESGDAEPGAREISFTPKRAPRPIQGKFDVHAFEKGNVPGNALIVLQGLLPVLARAGGFSRVTISGETYNPNTLTYDLFERMTLAAHRMQGLYAFPHLVTAGFGFASRGEVSLEVEPSSLEGLDWGARGALAQSQAVIALAEIGEDVGERGVAHARSLFDRVGLPVEAEFVQVNSKTPGAFVSLLLQYERGLGGTTAMGAKGVRIEQVVEEAFEALMDWRRTDATVDAYLADQLLVTAALASGPTTFRTPQITQRLLTMAWVIKQFLPIHLTIHGRLGESGTVVVHG